MDLITPRNDRVLIERMEDVPRGTIFLVDADKSMKGTVLAVGPGKKDEDGEIQPLDVAPGDVVYFNSKWNDMGEQYQGEGPMQWPRNWHLVQEADIIGRVNG